MTETNPEQVSLDRIVEAMKGFDIELTVLQENTVATANLDGLPCTFAVLPTVAIVRAEVGTDMDFEQADAGLFLAANQINSAAIGARAVIAEHEGKLIVRTERDIPTAAGMTDQQLAGALKKATDGVISAQDAMVAAAEEMQKLNPENPENPENPGNEQ